MSDLHWAVTQRQAGRGNRLEAPAQVLVLWRRAGDAEPIAVVPRRGLRVFGDRGPCVPEAQRRTQQIIEYDGHLGGIGAAVELAQGDARGQAHAADQAPQSGEAARFGPEFHVQSVRISIARGEFLASLFIDLHLRFHAVDHEVFSGRAAPSPDAPPEPPVRGRWSPYVAAASAGNSRSMVAPSALLSSTSSRPPQASMIARTISSPVPCRGSRWGRRTCSLNSSSDPQAGGGHTMADATSLELAPDPGFLLVLAAQPPEPTKHDLTVALPAAPRQGGAAPAAARPRPVRRWPRTPLPRRRAPRRWPRCRTRGRR